MHHHLASKKLITRINILEKATTGQDQLEAPGRRK
jgi:hypothetical protein